MSTFWTPSGERPIPRDEPDRPAAPPGPPRGGGEPDFDDEEIQAELRAMQEQMLRTPAVIVVANHCIGLVELAALHLGQNPPNLADAQVAIDALGGMLDAVGARMGENGAALSQALNQMRMAYVEAKKSVAKDAASTPEG